MKRLLLLLLIPLLWAMPVEAAVSWESYSDAARTMVSDNFTQYGSWVYLKGIGLQKNKDYRAAFYDAQNVEVWSEVGTSDNNGVFKAQVRPSDDDTSKGGTWKAELWKKQPLTLEATDTFSVLQSAIPEFENMAAIIGVLGLCLLIYIKIKRGENASQH